MSRPSIPLFTAALTEGVPKGYRRGTHRSIAPADTLARVRPLTQRMGITRLGDITGLDRIGIPVAVAVRPNSRSVSVSQGKGVDREQAMASALMEACEGFHAEEVGPLLRASYRELAAGDRVVDLDALPAAEQPFDADAAISWVRGCDLLDGKACWLPAETVHTDFTVPSEGYFLASSNGVASGNHPVEAVLSAVCELIERDAVALHHARDIEEQAARTVDLATVDDPDCLGLLDRYRRAGFAVRVWDVASDIAIPAFLCRIVDPEPGEPGRLRRFHGSGSHPDPAVALSRALTEAAQSRLTYIAGIRDDLDPAEYREPPEADIADALLAALGRQSRAVSFRDVQGLAADDLAADLAWVLSCLAGAGLHQIVAVDLTRPEFGVPVARVVIPGLEADPRHPGYRPGPRARRIADVASALA